MNTTTKALLSGSLRFTFFIIEGASVTAMLVSGDASVEPAIVPERMKTDLGYHVMVVQSVGHDGGVLATLVGVSVPNPGDVRERHTERQTLNGAVVFVVELGGVDYF